jgi:hypothetical protein
VDVRRDSSNSIWWGNAQDRSRLMVATIWPVTNRTSII